MQQSFSIQNEAEFINWIRIYLIVLESTVFLVFIIIMIKIALIDIFVNILMAF